MQPRNPYQIVKTFYQDKDTSCGWGNSCNKKCNHSTYLRVRQHTNCKVWCYKRPNYRDTKRRYRRRAYLRRHFHYPSNLYTCARRRPTYEPLYLYRPSQTLNRRPQLLLLKCQPNKAKQRRAKGRQLKGRQANSNTRHYHFQGTNVHLCFRTTIAASQEGPRGKTK